MKRIEKMLSLIDSHIGVADVGTDHGLLPVSLALQGYRGNLVATDIHELPCLTDGLDGLDPSMIDTIVVAGLGGDVICSILDRAEWTMNPRYQLLLQPMTKAEVLRFWLCNNGYEITEEDLVNENDRLFRIISAKFSGNNTTMTDAELYLGKIKLIHDSDGFDKLLEQEIGRMRKKSEGLLTSEKYREAAFYRNILQEMLEIRKNREAEKGEG